MTESLMLEISGKEGLYAVSARELLKSPSYTDSDGLHFLKEIREQSTQGVNSSFKLYGADLLERIDTHLTPSNVEVIKVKKAKSYIIILTIHGKPSPGTLGDYWLLKDEYKRMDPTWIHEHPNQWRQLNFNDQYMNYMLEQFGELHCEYCSKPNLKIYKWYDKQDTKDMCTTDHFHSRKNSPHLAEDPSNLIIACHKCNSNKGAKEYDENQIAYIYDDTIRAEFVFDESKLSEKEFKRPNHG